MKNTDPFWVTFTIPGANKITFFIEDQTNIGCYDTITMTIHVQGIDIPNVFTPNGDGVNDFFVIDNHGMQTLQTLIFNRWGEKVFEWNTTHTDWDGKGLDGEDVSEGVYYYILTAVGEDGHPYEERGAVTLIR
jgi:gliding motility-associated-like protein